MAGLDIERREVREGEEKNRGSSSHISSSSFIIEDTETQWTSWLVPMFIVANIAVFIVVMYINNCPKHNNKFEGKCVATFLERFSFQPLRENPLFGPSSATLEKMGALESTKVVDKHQAWRLITCIWLHAGIFHLLANMIFLAFIGIRLEQQFGFVRIGVIYLLSGLGGSVLSSLFVQNNISVGASGALFGLLGAMLSELLTNWTVYTNKAAALVTILVIVIVNLGLGILPHVNNFGHIGGFFTGFLLGFVLLPRPKYGWLEQRNIPGGVGLMSKYNIYQYVLWMVSLVLLIVGFTVALVMLFRGENGNDRCHWCHYLNCVPTSRWICD